MKPLIPIIIAVAVGILSILVLSQQTQLNELQRNAEFERAMNYCELNYMMSSQLQDCITNAFETFGTQQEIENWHNYLNEEETKMKNREDFILMMDQDCRERYIGQIQEMNDCIEANHRLLP